MAAALLLYLPAVGAKTSDTAATEMGPLGRREPVPLGGVDKMLDVRAGAGSDAGADRGQGDAAAALMVHAGHGLK